MLHTIIKFGLIPHFLKQDFYYRNNYITLFNTSDFLKINLLITISKLLTSSNLKGDTHI